MIETTDTTDMREVVAALEAGVAEAKNALMGLEAAEAGHRVAVDVAMEDLSVGKLTRGQAHAIKTAYAKSQEETELGKARLRRLERESAEARTALADARSMDEWQRRQESAARQRERHGRILAAIGAYVEELDAIGAEFSDLPRLDMRSELDLSTSRTNADNLRHRLAHSS